MKNIQTILILVILFSSCQPKSLMMTRAWHESSQIQYKLIQSKVSNKNDIWKVVKPQIQDFPKERYLELKPLIFDRDIPAIQNSIKEGLFTYEELTKWYLFRILKFENDNSKTLHTIITINPSAVSEAKKRDKEKNGDHPIYGMPVLLKDNINTIEMPTTAGAVALMNNQTDNDAFIIQNIKKKGGIILGKLSLSEWANFFCEGCPNGYSAVGGQTLNPYGRMKFDTGGSSSGSGTSMAANYAAAAVGTETSGSILSPSSANSIVGLKPTIGTLSRRGIVPISGTLDTPGPMTRNVTDNAILLAAMYGEDPEDPTTVGIDRTDDFITDLAGQSLDGLRFGVIKSFLEDSLHRETIQQIEKRGGIMIEIDPKQIPISDFVLLLKGDMKRDLKNYFEKYGSDSLDISSVAEVVKFNTLDPTIRVAYNQNIFKAIVKETISDEELTALKVQMNKLGIKYFEDQMTPNNLDAVLSVNNWSASYAALAKYPCLTVPMGYTTEGCPMGITFITRPYTEKKLLQIGYAFEQATNARKAPKDFL